MNVYVQVLNAGFTPDPAPQLMSEATTLTQLTQKPFKLMFPQEWDTETQFHACGNGKSLNIKTLSGG